MKKILCLILALVLCFTVFVACDNTQKEDPAATTLENATAYLKTMYKGYLTNPETPADYELVTSLMVDGQTYTVEWSVDNEAVKVVVAEDGSKVTVDIDEKSTAVAEYNLTAVVTAPDGTKGDPLTFKLKVPSANFLPIADALKAEDGTFVTVSGTVALINTPWDDGYKNITVTIEDENGDQLYLYRLSTKVEVGDVLMVKGEMATYNGNRQMAQGCTAEIIGKEEVKTEYIDMTIPEALAADDNTLVCVKGTVKIINTAWSDQYKNISVTIVDEDGNELYLYRLATKVEQGDVLTVKGVMATYNGNRQIAQGATAEITGKQDIVLVYEEKTIPEVLALADGALVCVQGTVKSVDTEWSDDYKNISVTIVDADGNELYLYRLATKVQAGDTLTVKGIVGSYEGKKQIVSGTAEIGSAHGDNHVYTNDCDVDCDICGAERTPKDHVYDNACDVDCNVCDAEREVEAHVYDNSCDADCNVCGAKREVSAHVYNNACDADCNVCGAKREVEDHVYDNACDAYCNVCEAEREVAAHVFKNACDADCDVCGAKRNVADHVYDNACDVDCNECGEKREAAAHVYDNACDADCNVCGAKRETSHTTVAECDEECDVCGAKIENAAEHTWSAECDKNCDKCNESRPVDCKDENDDGKCDYCEAVVDTATIEKGHIEYEAGKIKFNDVHVSGEATLPAVGAGYADVAITWTVDNADVAKIADGKVTFTAGAEDVTVTLTATFVCGDTTETKTYTVKVTVHTYDNACDADCNVCQGKRTPADHVYDNACDADCNVCSAKRAAADHVYDNACDADCNVCGAKRDVEGHKYENDCATKCVKCGLEREVGDHKYDDCEDVSCNSCGAPRTAPGHVYDNACDAECNECKATRTPADHVYDNACDADCNECGATRTPAAHVYDNCEDADCNVCDATRTPSTCKDDNGDEKCDACGVNMVAETPYKLYMEHGGKGGKYYFLLATTQSNENKFINTTNDPKAAPDFYMEAVEGGYKIYTLVDNTKTYIKAATIPKTDGSGVSKYLGFDTTGSVFVYSDAYQAWYTTIDGVNYVMGTYGTYETASISEESFYTDSSKRPSQYPVTFIAKAEGEAMEQPKEPEVNDSTIEEALSAPDGTAVELSGTVVGFYETWSSYGNCSPYIADAAGNQILVFRTTTQVGLGDVISVVGTISVYNNTNQIAQGSTVTITAPHVCSEWDEATCKAPKTCKVCGATEGEVADHVYVGGVCDVCGAAEGVELQKATVAYTETTTTNMTGNNDAATLGLDASVFTVVGEKGSKDIFPGLNKSGQIRLYGSNGDGNALKVTVAEGYSISSIKITFGTSNKSNCQISAGDTVLTTTTSSSEAVLSLDINADSFTLKNLNSGTTQIYILSIEITYFAE